MSERAIVLHSAKSEAYPQAVTSDKPWRSWKAGCAVRAVQIRMLLLYAIGNIGYYLSKNPEQKGSKEEESLSEAQTSGQWRKCSNFRRNTARAPAKMADKDSAAAARRPSVFGSRPAPRRAHTILSLQRTPKEQDVIRLFVGLGLAPVQQPIAATGGPWSWP
ncbi:hypothetical protein EVAR_95102_1 [Eumeta japonica]|uniref:Uncharacterized protein n=1 Tax=Eumeta variegata TaxID=151549 RepID=A0A4C1W6W9_EUMVA|nr:hypothetical protein EVAR_95102_1 [Eumeta japonica]